MLSVASDFTSGGTWADSGAPVPGLNLIGGTSAFVGFTSGAGSALEFRDIHSWSLSSTTLNSGNAYCFGDGTGASCPCSAFGGQGQGCSNTGGSGAAITGSGNASLGSDTLQFAVSGLSGTKPGLILRGDNQIANPVGDGILCTAGNSQPSQVQVTVGGMTTYTDFAGNPFGTVANIGAPTNFQFWYRDASNPCSGSGFNFTNAWTVTYLP